MQSQSLNQTFVIKRIKLNHVICYLNLANSLINTYVANTSHKILS